jgi:hypothetical protein
MILNRVSKLFLALFSAAALAALPACGADGELGEVGELGELDQVNEAASELAPSPPTASLKLWLSADANVLVNNGKVSQWLDRSGNNLNAQMPTLSRQPTLVNGALNGLPVIRFYGAQSLGLTALLSPSKFTFFVVGKNSKAAETFSMILGPASNSPNNQLRWENGSQALLVGTGNNLPVVTASTGNTRVYHTLSGRYDGSTLTVYRDGNLVKTQSFVTSGPWTLYQIGAWYSSYFMEGDLAEILFYDQALVESDQAAANTYLKNKYFPLAP